MVHRAFEVFYRHYPWLSHERSARTRVLCVLCHRVVFRMHCIYQGLCTLNVKPRLAQFQKNTAINNTALAVSGPGPFFHLDQRSTLSYCCRSLAVPLLPFDPVVACVTSHAAHPRAAPGHRDREEGS